MRSFVLLDSETTEDEGEENFETKEDGGDFEDQALHTGIYSIVIRVKPITNTGLVNCCQLI